MDLADLAAHTQYSGGYHAEHPVIISFWKVRTRIWAEFFYMACLYCCVGLPKTAVR